MNEGQICRSVGTLGINVPGSQAHGRLATLVSHLPATRLWDWEGQEPCPHLTLLPFPSASTMPRTGQALDKYFTKEQANLENTFFWRLSLPFYSKSNYYFRERHTVQKDISAKEGFRFLKTCDSTFLKAEFICSIKLRGSEQLWQGYCSWSQKTRIEIPLCRWLCDLG